MTPSNPPRLRLTYDTELNPLSFDIVHCLAICRVYCQMNGLADKFDVALVNRAFRNVAVEATYAPEYRVRKFRDVLVSTVLLCKWVNSVQIVRRDTSLALHDGPVLPLPQALPYVGKVPQWQITPQTSKQLEALLQQGGKIPDPGFQASAEIHGRYRDRLKNAVVIHPRISNYVLSRNTDKAKMQEVARLLRAAGKDVYFVPDIEDVRSGFSWADFGPPPLMEAAFDLETRIGVSECAFANLVFSGGGNAAMLQFTRAHFLWTGFVDDSERNTSTAFMLEKGSAIGVNPPWLDAATQFYDWTSRPEVTPDYMVQHLLRLGRR